MLKARSVSSSVRLARWKNTTSLMRGAPRKKCWSIAPRHSGGGVSSSTAWKRRSLRFSGKPGRGEQPRLRIRGAVRADEEVVHLARRHHAPHRPDRIERRARLGVELHRRMQKQAAVGAGG